MTSLKRDSRDVSNFSKLDFQAAGEIHLSQSEHYSLEIEAEESTLDILTSEVVDGLLVLGVEKNRNIRTDLPIRYTITMPKIELVRISGSGKLHLPSLSGASFLLDILGAAKIDIGLIEVNAFTMDVKGSANGKIAELKAQGLSFDIKGALNLDIPSLKAEALTNTIEGTAKLEFAGQTTAQIIHAPGVLNYEASSLQSSQVTINAQGMSNATLWVTDILTARIQGVGNISYYGNPERSIKINGMGKVNRIGDKPKIVSIV
jgi:hypothetical protein